MLGEPWHAEALRQTHATEMAGKHVALNTQNADLKSKIAKQPKALPVAKAMLKSKPNRKSGHSEHLQTLLRKGNKEEAVELWEPSKTTFEDVEANNAVRDASEQGCRGPGVHGVCLFMLPLCPPSCPPLCHLKAKNVDLEAKNVDLEAKNADLEAKNAELVAKNADLEAKNAELQARLWTSNSP